MPSYDYRCRACDTRFEVRRGIADSAAPAPCPAGHLETSRVFTPVAVGGASGAAPRAASPAAAGGCCGGGCCG